MGNRANFGLPYPHLSQIYYSQLFLASLFTLSEFSFVSTISAACGVEISFTSQLAVMSVSRDCLR